MYINELEALITQSDAITVIFKGREIDRFRFYKIGNGEWAQIHAGNFYDHGRFITLMLIISDDSDLEINFWAARGVYAEEFNDHFRLVHTIQADVNRPAI